MAEQRTRELAGPPAVRIGAISTTCAVRPTSRIGGYLASLARPDTGNVLEAGPANAKGLATTYATTIAARMA